MNKTPKKSPRLNLYSNLANKRRTKKDLHSRKKAEYLATLPKHPVQRVLYRLHPKRVWGYWASKNGAFMALKIVGVFALILLVGFGSLFAYYRKDLDAIRPGELAKRVQSTVTKYYDRNGELLWEDKGEGNYTLVVDGNKIAPYMKQATIAIEDRDFYKHGGVSPAGITRAALSNMQGNSVQGGSTLTQQLVKQVFFADEAQERGLAGIPRKIKEIILSIEVERMYSKDQILDLYLNESPYGGRRNGVESAAQTYFGKNSKELTLAESALLAAIPNQPGLYDPYNVAGHEALVARQHKVLASMVETGSITQAQADEAKKVPILDTIKPLSEQYANIKAPHFVQYVRNQLEQQLGKAVVGRGGLTVKTTLDLKIQNKLEESMNDMFTKSGKPQYAGFSNGASIVEDSQSGQIVAMMGSRDFNYPGFGQDNATTAYIQPGSTIKPLVYAELFKNKGEGKTNYGSGSVLADDHGMDKLYGAPLKNADGKWMGNINIRKALALSRNVPAVKAMYVSGVKPTWETIRDLGNISYCTQGADAQAGLSSAIGGCGTRMIDHVNSFASLARMGVYKPTSVILEVKNSQGATIKKFTDQSKQVLDPQIAYILADILSDDNARAGLYGRNFYGLNVPGVKTAVKTGTSDKGGKPKDIWTLSYSPALTMGVWLGNPDTSVLTNGNSSIPAKIIGDVMGYAHTEVYAKENLWKSGDWFSQPQGIQRIGGELFPSWYNKKSSSPTEKMVFDKVSKKKASSCTPDGAKIELGVTKSQDPISKKDTFMASDGYDPNSEDNVHKCDDMKPTATITKISSDGKTITVSVADGTFKVNNLEVKVNGQTVSTMPVTAGTHNVSNGGVTTGTLVVTATVTDEGYYSTTATNTQTVASQ